MSSASGLVVGPVDPALASVLAEAGVATASTDGAPLDAASAAPDLVLLPFSAARGADAPVAEVRLRFPGASLVLVVPSAERVAGSAAARELDAGLVVTPIERRPTLATIERTLALRSRRREIDALADRVRRSDPAAADAVQALGRELAEKTRAVDEALAFRTSALANLVHEVRTPLTVLQGFADLLEEDLAERIDEDQRQLVRGVRSSAAQLGTVVGGLVDLARAETGRLAARTASVFLPDVLADAARTLEPELRGRPIRFVLDVDRRLGWIRTEPDWLRQILSCLLSNATKFTAAGEVRLAARVAMPRVSGEAVDAASLLRSPDGFGDFVELAVSDTGCGIPLADQTRIFDAFHQEDPSTTRRHEGLGIGLTIVRELAKALGASLDLESVPGEGTTVRLRIPVDRTAADAPATTAARSVRTDAAGVDRLAEIATLHRLAPTRIEEAVPLALRAIERSLGASIASYATLSGVEWRIADAIGDESAAAAVPRSLLEEAARQGRATENGGGESRWLGWSLRDASGHRFGVLACRIPAGGEDGAWLTLQAVGGWLAGVRTSLSAAAERTEIASVLARSVKDPLGALLAYTQVLLRGLRGPLTDEQRTIVLRLEKGIHRAILSVLDLLDYERSRGRSFETRRISFSLASVLEHVLSRHAAALELSRIRVERDVPFDLPLCLGDEIRTDRAISAVLRAVVDAAGDGATIVLRARDRPAAVELRLEAPVRKSEPFRLAFAPVGPPAELDDGLGLALARIALESQGGRILVDVGEPMVTRIELPRGT